MEAALQRASLNSAIGRIDPSAIREALRMASKMPEGGISLAIGDPDLPIPAPIKGCLRNGIRLDQTRYTPTEGLPELRELILGQYSSYGLESVIITAGVSGAIDLLCRVLLEPGRSAVILEPYFPMYESGIRFMGAAPIIVPMAPDCKVNLVAVEKAISNSNASMIFVNSPNNPSGRVYSQEEIRGIAEIANKYGVYVISDEIYDSLSYDGEVPNFLGLAEKLVVLNGYAKNYSLTGSRIGYAVGPAWIIDAMAKAQMYSYVCANSVAQWAIMYTWDQVDISDRVEIYRERRDLVWETLRREFTLPKPQGAFYAFIEAPPVTTGKVFRDACLEQGVLVVPSGGSFTERDTHVRISYALPTDQLKEGLRRIVAAKHALVR